MAGQPQRMVFLESQVGERVDQTLSVSSAWAFVGGKGLSTILKGTGYQNGDTHDGPSINFTDLASGRVQCQRGEH